MAVQFGDDTSRLVYAPATQYNNLPRYTVMLHVVFDGFQASGFDNFLINKFNEASLATGWIFSYFGNAANRFLRFRVDFSTTDGVWNVNSLPLNTGTLYHLAFSYDQSSTSNDPVIYVNGVSQTVTESSTPSGSANDNSAYNLIIGTPFNGQGLFGTVYSCNLYNYIMSASEIADAYASKLAIPSTRGLVFAPQLWNVQDGAVLGSTNIIRDLISGAAGTPSGSPTGRADNVLQIEGIN